jgi:PAS domain S-box-containing protein
MTMAQNFEIQLQGLMVSMLTIEKKFAQILLNLLILGFILLFYSTPTVLGTQQIERKKILVLFPFRPTLPVASQWDRGLRSIFENNSAIKPVINFEYLDLIHFGDEQHVNMLLDLYRYKYSNPMPDLIIPVLDSSLDLMLKYGDKVFPGVPIVFGGVESQFIKNRSLPSNITGYLTDINYTGTLELALDLHKDTRNVVVVAGGGKVVGRWVESAQKEYDAYKGRYGFTYLVGLPMKDLLEKMRNLPPKTIVISLPVLVDGTGKEYIGNESLALVTQASTAPVYTFWDVCVGTGIVGGYMGSFEKEAEAVAKLGLRVLNSEIKQEIPVTQAPKFSYIFDWHQLKRWSIPENKLPPESIIMFEDLTTWDQYKGRIVGVLVMILLQALIIFYLLFQRRIRLQAEEEAKQAEVKYRTVADFTYDWEYWVNADGKLEYVSPSCERISGYSTDDFISNPFLMQDIIIEEDRDIWDEHTRRLSEEFKSSESQFRICREDGTTRWVEQSSQAVVDDKGYQLGFRSSIRDISKRKESELEIKSLKDKLQAESAYLQDEIKIENDFDNIVGHSDELKYILHHVELVASTDSPVLILGETGTGKELIARAIHHLSPRSNRALVKVNCAALPSNLIESELFGREKGAYSGADNLQIGRFELASESTIFLDEIGEIPLDLQAKLLQVLESGEFQRLGNPRTLQSTARIITATNRDLQVEVSKGRFREDLLYRLNAFTITVPPLRKRKDDIPMLVNWFLNNFSRKMGKPIPQISKNTIEALQDYNWPGNVRELKNTIERSFITCPGDKFIVDLPESPENLPGSIKTFQEMEHDYILEILKAKNWKISGKDSAASALDMHVNTLRSRMNKLGITKSK